MKRKLVIVLSLVLLFSVATSALTFAAEPVTVGIKGSDVKVIHRDAPAPIIKRDPVIPWTENVEMRNLTNQHFLTWTQVAIATGIAEIAGGGTVAFWTGLAGSVYANAECTETHNVYYDIRYYWQPSGDPYLPYYIKQVVYCYSDPSRTDFVGYKTRYYYSTVTF